MHFIEQLVGRGISYVNEGINEADASRSCVAPIHGHQQTPYLLLPSGVGVVRKLFDEMSQ
jgi:hypothetical protein